jgi:hypothetical protein
MLCTPLDDLLAASEFQARAQCYFKVHLMPSTYTTHGNCGVLHASAAAAEGGPLTWHAKKYMAYGRSAI